MPCEKPVIAPIDDECCFSCYTEDRGSYQTPIAIVLHEVDEHIEALNNRLENCCHNNPDCHSSFHYGIGHDGRIINWVDPNNTAWSFDPTNSDQNCGICGWSIATQEGTGINPNLYTINVAVSTGILAFDQSSPNSLAENNYTEHQYNALVRLVGWLAETYGIVINQNNIWRHCDELNDFPGGCCCNEQNENCDCLTYSDFLEAVQDCIDSAVLDCPVFCDCMCDAVVTDGFPSFIFGADEECNLCGRYAFDLCSMFTGLPETDLATIYLIGIDDQDECSYMPLDPTCDETSYNVTALGYNDAGDLGFRRPRSSMPYREAFNGESLIPAEDGVVALDAENASVIFTLTAPGPCDSNSFWISRLDCNDQTSVTINGGANTINGQAAITLDTPGRWGCGETAHLYWNGTEWMTI